MRYRKRAMIVAPQPEAAEAVLTRDDAQAMLRRPISRAPHRARREAFVILHRDP